MSNEYGIIDNDRSSIEVSQNAKGQYAFKVKIYFNSNTMDTEDIVKEAEFAYTLLKKKFK